MEYRHKYHRTKHFPWTLYSTTDDKIHSQKEVEEYFDPMEDAFASKKRDGENTSIYWDGHTHARSIDSKDHWSRHHIKQLAQTLVSDIPHGWRICGENLLAVHSIPYYNLDSFFEVFAIFDDKNNKLGLDATLEYCDLFGLKHVPILKRCSFKKMKGLYIPTKFGLDLTTEEGYVIANAKGYHYDDAYKNIGKFVRANHVTTDDHWMLRPSTIENKNKLNEGAYG